MLIYAHRGSSGRLPENTLAALRGAIADGADGIEIDLHATADGTPVLLHDRDLARTTSGSGPVDALSDADRSRLDAGNGEPVPTFAAALGVAAGRLRLDVEVKRAGIGERVLAELRRVPEAEWFVSSFDWDILRAFRALDRTARLWPLADRCDDSLLAVAADLGAPGVALAASAYTPEIAAALAGRGLDCAVWTVNDAAEARRVRDLGAAILITDWPAEMRAALAT